MSRAPLSDAADSRLCHLAAHDWDWIDHPPRISMLPETKKEKFLTREEVEAVAARYDHHGPTVLMAAYTGIRISHLLRLTGGDYVDGCLRLDRTGKTGILQSLPVHERIREIVNTLPLTSTYPGFYRAFKRACKDLGIDARPHDLRHTLASWLVQSNANLKVIQEFLGHKDIKTTQRYTHLRTGDLRTALDRV
ncbi:MAG: hypothetical protein NVS9B10_22670 [Nevskia sp.]